MAEERECGIGRHAVTGLLLACCMLLAGCGDTGSAPTTDGGRPQGAEASDANSIESMPTTTDAEQPDSNASGGDGFAEADTSTEMPSVVTREGTPVTARLLDWKQSLELAKSQQGKVVVVDVWSTSCLPCMREFPGLVSLQESHTDDVVCISVNIDFIGDAPQLTEELREYVMDFLVKRNAQLENIICTDPDSTVYDNVEFASIPAVYVFDRAGELRKLFSNDANEFGEEEGFTYQKHITPFVEELLSAK